jgi:hypothetical protein
MYPSKEMKFNYFMCLILIMSMISKAHAQYEGWKKEGTLTILTTPDGANLPATTSVENFPLLVRLSKASFDFQQAKTGGEDIRFSSAGQPLAYLIETWDEEKGTASIWIKIPQIKGGKSLFVDFRPPSSGGQVGPYYTKTVEEIRAALADLGDQKYVLAGFYWQQGWNDMCEPLAIPEYADNLVNLVKDIRKEFNVPKMPVVVGELGNGGPDAEGGMLEFRKAQESGTKKISNAVFVHTTDFARPAELSPCPTHGHHWFANAESYFLIGDAAGEAMKTFLK